MIQHRNTLLSLDIFDRKFICDLRACRGACCVEGDFGAPLEKSELNVIRDNLDGIRPFLTQKSRDLLDMEDFWEIDPMSQYVTKCIRSKDCIFVVRDHGISCCAIEKAWESGKSTFKKPVSCHLYPIRLGKSGKYITVNYHRWSICDPAILYGIKNNTPLYIFLKEPLIRKFGQDWYNELLLIAQAYEEEKPFI